MNQQPIILEKKDGVAVITLNRPEAMNAIDKPMRAMMESVLHDVGQDDAVRVLLVTGAGRAFCAGVDVTSRLKQLAAGPDRESRQEMLKYLGEFVRTIYYMEKPTIAAVNGMAMGAGLSLSLACDIRLAAENARFGAAWTRRGVIPDAGATFFLPRLLGISTALELCYLGKIIDAAEALRIGMVSRVLPPDKLMESAMELASQIARGPSVALELTKRGMFRGVSADLESQLLYETYAQRVCFTSEDFQEGIKSFEEKRDPQFKGR